jgi:hypothetical protein
MSISDDIAKLPDVKRRDTINVAHLVSARDITPLSALTTTVTLPLVAEVRHGKYSSPRSE